MKSYWNFLIVLAVIFWIGLLFAYFGYYFPLPEGNFLVLKEAGAEINYIWFRLAQIGAMAIVTIGGLLYFRKNI
jgi:hypothetical protein